MAVLEILKFPDPRLRKKSEDVKVFDESIKTFYEDMLETMTEFRGIGLAAPQVARLERMILVDTRPAEDSRAEEGSMGELEAKIEQPLFLINPVIKKKEGKIKYDEGCLSVPTYFETVERSKVIEVEYFDKEGNKQSLTTDGLLSICIQHEIDHLDGKLFIDRLSTIKATRIKSKIKNYGYPEDDEEEDHTKDDHQL